jgi:hypothetical protein
MNKFLYIQFVILLSTFFYILYPEGILRLNNFEICGIIIILVLIYTVFGGVRYFVHLRIKERKRH